MDSLPVPPTAIGSPSSQGHRSPRVSAPVQSSGPLGGPRKGQGVTWWPFLPMGTALGLGGLSSLIMLACPFWPSHPTHWEENSQGWGPSCLTPARRPSPSSCFTWLGCSLCLHVAASLPVSHLSPDVYVHTLSLFLSPWVPRLGPAPTVCPPPSSLPLSLPTPAQAPMTLFPL